MAKTTANTPAKAGIPTCVTSRYEFPRLFSALIRRFMAYLRYHDQEVEINGEKKSRESFSSKNASNWS